MSPMETKDLVRLLAHVKGPGKLKGKRAHFSASTLPTSWTRRFFAVRGRGGLLPRAWHGVQQHPWLLSSPRVVTTKVSPNMAKYVGVVGGAVETPELSTPTSDFLASTK